MPGCPPLSQVPLGGRTDLAAERARLTGPTADNHLLTFGEFAAMYLTANNIGYVTLRESEITHRLLARTRAGTRASAATMPTGHDVLAALNGRSGPA